MKVLQLTEHYLPFSGGVETCVHEICKRLVTDGFEVEVVCEREKETAKHEIMDGVRVHRVFGFEPIKFKYGVGRVAPTMLLSTIRSDADIVHAHSYGFFPTWVSLFTNKPTIVTTHSDPSAKIYPLWDLLREVPIRLCDHVVATTEMEKQHLVYRGVRPGNITVIPNGLAFPPPEAPEFDFSPMIFCLARLDIAHKGQDVLLKAMPKVLSTIPEVRLFIAGGGDDLEKLRELAKKLGIEKNIEFKGLVDQFSKNVYMKNCDVFCVSPRTESFGVVYLEAMAYGKPIVATNVGGIPEVLSGCGVLVPSNNPDLLAEALIEILTDRESAEELGSRGLERVKQFDWGVIVKRYEQVYMRLGV
ncbi:MAG: glycosyltransferase family 4 protein [Candidatus Bathyarchaeota archaeon]|nr:glycosyltransferase family 4 protein [Candidatus Bathyarchaeota archaeon]